ncbi:MAG: thioredoxin [Rhodospirillaceae bacterium]
MEFKLNPDGSLAPASGGETPGAPAGQDERPQVIMEGATAMPAAAPAAANGGVIKDSDTANFMADVIEASMQVPVLVDFWAPWCGPCKQLGPTLEKLVRQAGGMVRLVKINVDENQEIAAQLRVQSIPMVYAFKGGRPVDAFTGALPESQLKMFIDRLLGGAKPPIDAALEQAKQLLDAGQADQALQLYRQIQAEDPENDRAIAGIIRASLAVGDTESVKQIVAALPPELAAKGEIQAAISAFELTEQAGAAGDVAELAAKVEADPADHQARLDYAVALVAHRRHEDAIDQLIESIRRNRAWNDEAARKQLLKLFEALGPTHELTQSGRRRLSSVLFS